VNRERVVSALAPVDGGEHERGPGEPPRLGKLRVQVFVMDVETAPAERDGSASKLAEGSAVDELAERLPGAERRRDRLSDWVRLREDDRVGGGVHRPVEELAEITAREFRMAPTSGRDTKSNVTAEPGGSAGIENHRA
jgi:hypothetical protein